jgi:vacuolar-type H+-ATPase subunit F/Vma7
MTKVGNNQLAVIGNRTDTLPYIALGARVFKVSDSLEARERLIECVRDGHPVILVSEEMLSEIADTVDAVMENSESSVISIGGYGKNDSSGYRIREKVKNAIGISLP